MNINVAYRLFIDDRTVYCSPETLSYYKFYLILPQNMRQQILTNWEKLELKFFANKNIMLYK